MSVGETRKVSVVTLGCSKNVVDSEALMAQLAAGRVKLVEPDEAETVVINTCGFIEAAKQESIDAIVEAVEKKKRGEIAHVVVMGCLSERFREELVKEIPDVDAYIGANKIPEVLSSLGVDYRRELLGERRLTTPSHFAYLKISEGCDHPCSFCAIPLMRGKHASRPEDDVLHEASLLAAGGVKELIIIGQDTTAYGIDRGGRRSLAALLGRLQEIPGIEWMRLMYAYPAQFPDDLLDAFGAYPKLTRYLDIPVQHIADPVLRSMRRGITARATRELLSRIRTRIPGIALRTTLIVGYPNETEDEFRALCDFVEETRFHRLGVFPYSQEEGTTAAILGDPVPPEVKEERLATIMEIQQRISAERNQSLVGSVQRVLIDRSEEGQLVGRTEYDAPEIDQEVVLPDDGRTPAGTFVPVRITDAVEYDLFGERA